MQGDRPGGKGSGESDPQAWSESDWDPEEKPVRVKEHYRGGADIRSDIANVADDPLYDPPRGEGAGRTDPGRKSPGLSTGQKLLLWIGIALVSAVSFGGGLIVGAGGGFDAPFLGSKSEAIPGPEGFDALGPPLAPEGVIQFGDRGTVPSSIDDGGAISQADKSGGDKEKAPARATKKKTRPVKTVTAPPAKPKATTKAARKTAEKSKPKLVAAVDSEPKSASEPVPAPEAAPSEMTFYETSTGESEVTGLSGGDEEMEDAEAPPDAAPAPDRAAPAGADALTPRRVEKREDVSPPPDAGVVAEETPSGADLLARRQAAGTRISPAAPAANPGIRGDTYTVQVTTLADEMEARRLVARLKTRGFAVRIVPLTRSGLGTLYRIRVGRYPTEAAARSDLERLAAEPGAHPYIRME